MPTTLSRYYRSAGPTRFQQFAGDALYSGAKALYRRYRNRGLKPRGRGYVKARVLGHMRMRYANRRGNMGSRVVGSKRRARCVEYALKNNFVIDHRTLEFEPFTYPRRGNEFADNMHRQTDNLFVKGVRVNLKFTNPNEWAKTIHYGFIQPKGYVDNDFRTDFGVDATWIKDKFFRNNSVTGEKDESFIDNNAQHSFEYEHRKINGDKWNVLMHKKLHLSSRDKTEYNVPGHGARNITKWIKLNKTISFENGEDTIGVRPIIFFCWFQEKVQRSGMELRPITYDMTITPYYV